MINETVHERDEENSSIQSNSQACPSSSINMSELPIVTETVDVSTLQKAAQNGIETQLPEVQRVNETHDQSNDIDLETNINLNVENANNKKRPAKKEDSQEETTKKPSLKKKKGDFMCEMCKYTFALKQGLRRHIANVHERRKPFKCDSCDYTCSLKQSLECHISSAHEKWKFFCSVRNEEFTRNYIRTKHEGKCTEADKGTKSEEV